MSRGRIDHLCDQLSIRIVPFRRRRRGKQTHARRHMWKILKRHGEGHLVFVLRTIVETKNNAAELWSETIQAVSDVVLARPEWAATGGRWLEAFDSIELGQIRAEAKTMGWPKRQCIRVLLLMRLQAFFNASKQMELF